MEQLIFGVDVGATMIKIGLFENNGTLVKKWSIPTRKKGAFFLEDLTADLQREMNERDLAADDILGIGIGVPGAVRDGRLVEALTNIGSGIPDIRQTLDRRLGIDRIMLANDANAAALGEMWKGAGRGCENLVMITLGTGVGGGIVLGGRILEGTFGAAGEIGHIKVRRREEESCGCGKHGCLEQYASATGVTRIAEKLLQEAREKDSQPADEKKSVLDDIDELMAKDVFDAAREGDELAEAAVDCACEALGRAMAAVACVVDPQIFVIGGGVSAAGQILLDGVRRYYKKYAFPASEETPIHLAELKNDAGIYGAAHLILED